MGQTHSKLSLRSCMATLNFVKSRQDPKVTGAGTHGLATFPLVVLNHSSTETM